MADRRSSIFPLSVEAVFALLSAFSDEQFKTLTKQLHGSESLSTDDRRIAALAADLGTDVTEARAVVGAVSLIYEQIHKRFEEPVTSEDLKVLLAVDLPEHVKPRLYSRLAELLRRDASIDHYRSVRALKTGFLRNALAFSFRVDLRLPEAIGSTGRSDVVPLLQFKVLTDAEDSSQRTELFQLDRRALESLEDAVREVRRQIEAVEDLQSFSRLRVAAE